MFQTSSNLLYIQAMTAATLAAIAPATEDNLLHLDLTKQRMASAMAASMPATAALSSGGDAASAAAAAAASSVPGSVQQSSHSSHVTMLCFRVVTCRNCWTLGNNDHFVPICISIINFEVLNMGFKWGMTVLLI